MSAAPNQAVVIGAGTNELVAAHMLARAGRKVTLLEEHAGPDWASGWVPVPVLRAVGLEEKVHVEAADPWLVACLPDGGTLQLHRDVMRSAAAIRALSERDAAMWPQFCDRMARLAGFLERMYLETPADPRDLRLALRVRRLGRQGMEDLMRILPMPVAELLDEWFECDALKGALASLAVARLQQGPRSAGTAFRLLHQHAGNAPGVFRPPRSDFRRALREQPGIEIRATAASRLQIREGRITGVRLSDGAELAAGLVVSGVDVRRSLLELVDPGWLDPDLARAVRNIRSRGVVARVSLRVDRSPNLPPLVHAPSIDHLERAYDDAKYGRISRAPYMEAHCAGESVEIDLQYAPYRLAEGTWDDAKRRGLSETAAAFVTRAAPGIAVRQASVLAPPDLEAQLGWPQGQAEHAELALDQALWARPIPELAQYRTPIAGLWLCGPAMHPGPGIEGAAGYNCVREILRS